MQKKSQLQVELPSVTVERTRMPTKNKHALCKALLDEIQESVSVFKPSKSLYAFSNLEICDRDHSQAEVDLVISGGALKGYYVAGCSHILQAVFLQQGIRIMRIAGASAGSMIFLRLKKVILISIFLVLNVPSRSLGWIVYAHESRN